MNKFNIKLHVASMNFDIEKELVEERFRDKRQVKYKNEKVDLVLIQNTLTIK